MYLFGFKVKYFRFSGNKIMEVLQKLEAWLHSEKKNQNKYRERLVLFATSCTMNLKILPIKFKIIINKRIAHIFSLIL